MALRFCLVMRITFVHALLRQRYPPCASCLLLSAFCLLPALAAAFGRRARPRLALGAAFVLDLRLVGVAALALAGRIHTADLFLTFLDHE